MSLAENRESESGCLESLNPSLQGMQPSATLAINERCCQLRAAGQDVCHLGFGQSPFPVPEPVVESLQANASQSHYLPVQGLSELRQAVASYHRKFDALDCRAEDIVIGPGSKELMFLLRLVLGGETIVASPCWVSYVPQAKLLGRPVSEIETDFDSRWILTAEQLENHCAAQGQQRQTRLLILNGPSNPTGCSYQPKELAALAETARRWGILVLSDEIYAAVHFAGQSQSISRYYREGTIVSSGLSKWCGAGGWRLGTMAFPEELSWLKDALCTAASETYSAVSAPIQYAAVRAFQVDSVMEEYLQHCRRILATIGRWIAGSVRGLGVQVHDPAGGFYIFPDFEPLRPQLARRGIENSIDLCQALLEEAQLAALPGVDFQRPLSELTARFAFVDFDGRQALLRSREIGLASELPESFVPEICPSMVAGMQRLSRWTDQKIR